MYNIRSEINQEKMPHITKIAADLYLPTCFRLLPISTTAASAVNGEKMLYMRSIPASVAVLYTSQKKTMIAIRLFCNFPISSPRQK